MIGAIFRRLRARRARKQVRWMTGFIRSRYGGGHDIARRQALEAWSRVKP
jgi:hypothetical protein